MNISLFEHDISSMLWALFFGEAIWLSRILEYCEGGVVKASQKPNPSEIKHRPESISGVFVIMISAVDGWGSIEQVVLLHKFGSIEREYLQVISIVEDYVVHREESEGFQLEYEVDSNSKLAPEMIQTCFCEFELEGFSSGGQTC